MPEKHWAEESVFKLLKLGITQGLPDGTFQGMRKINRYEISGFIYQMARQTGLTPEIKKITAELNNEFNLEKYRIQNPVNPYITGKLSAGTFFSAAPQEKAIISNYRAIINLEKKYGNNAGLKITLDTMDLHQDHAGKVIDFSGNVKFLEADICAAMGPGDVIYQDPPSILLSGTVFRRQKPSLNAKVEKPNFEFGGTYTVLENDSNGLVGAQDFSLTAGIRHDRIKANLSAHLAKGTKEDRLAFLELGYRFNPIASIDLLLGAGSLQSSGLCAGIKGKLGNIGFHLYKAGSEFRADGVNKYQYLPLNLFDKYILDGTCDAGLSFLYQINPVWSLKLLSDAVLRSDYKFGEEYPGTSLTCQGELSAKLNSNLRAGLLYRTSVINRSDMVGLVVETQI